MLYFTILLALFAGIGDPFLALTLKKPKENHCFWLRTLKNLRKTFVFAFPRASGDPGGTIGPTTPKKLYITNSRSTAQVAVMLTWARYRDNITSCTHTHIYIYIYIYIYTHIYEYVNPKVSAIFIPKTTYAQS